MQAFAFSFQHLSFPASGYRAIPSFSIPLFLPISFVLGYVL
ncbi:hypothetical protein NAL19_882 [Pectobacterium sp. F1-1]|nr:hypothetical protein NAL19_882 [Pectobacterium sp. F1-1]